MGNLILLVTVTLGFYIILSLSLNLTAGFTGLLSLCHAAFFGIGAYVTAILSVTFGVNFWLALPLSGIFTALTGLLIGMPTLRLKGDYLAIATLGFAEIVRNILTNWTSLTGGPNGISGVIQPEIFGYKFNPLNRGSYLILVYIMVLITYGILRRIIRSRFGRALEAVREDEIAASSMGINITKYKVASFMIGAFFAGTAGSIYAVFIPVVVPDSFNFMLSVNILCMVVLGGMGNHLGAILGAVIIYVSSMLPQIMGFSSKIRPELNQIAFGLILVLMMIYRPQGILGRKKPDFEKLLPKSVRKGRNV